MTLLDSFSPSLFWRTEAITSIAFRVGSETGNDRNTREWTRKPSWCWKTWGKHMIQRDRGDWVHQIVVRSVQQTLASEPYSLWRRYGHAGLDLGVVKPYGGLRSCIVLSWKKTCLLVAEEARFIMEEAHFISIEEAYSLEQTRTHHIKQTIQNSNWKGRVLLVNVPARLVRGRLLR